jgi:hypothetical protein
LRLTIDYVLEGSNKALGESIRSKIQSIPVSQMVPT